MTSLIEVQPVFTYPKSTQFPFDMTCARIIYELSLRDWNVPGIKIKTDVYGSGRAKHQRICSIEGEDFLINFYSDGPRHIVIPYIDLSVFSDESGPSLIYYVGDDYEADKEWFKHSIKVHAKLNNEPRKYLKYEGIRNFGRALTIKHTTDLDREYELDPYRNEPAEFETEQIFNEFVTYLEAVLSDITQYPETYVSDDDFEDNPPIKAAKAIPYSGIFDTVYVPIDINMVNHIKAAKEAFDTIEDDKAYAVQPNRRLCNLHVKCDGRFDEKCFNGFVWCDPNISNITIKNSKDLIASVAGSQSSLWYDTNSVAVVKLKYNNSVYVVDDNAFTSTKQAMFDANPSIDRLSDTQVNDCYAERAKTFVPIDKYKGGYITPIVLLDRELEIDEVVDIIEYKYK